MLLDMLFPLDSLPPRLFPLVNLLLDLLPFHWPPSVVLPLLLPRSLLCL
jgi:hypothetical protein